jgi:hypothetical protein
VSIFFILAVSYNQPIFCPNASWDPNAITLANESILAVYPSGIFVSSNDTIYVIDRANNRVLVWLNEDNNSTGIISGNLNSPYSIFVTITGDIYIDNGVSNGRVDKWAFNANTSVPAMSVSTFCTGLFVDISDTLYCSMQNNHQVVKRWLNDNAATLTIVAGVGTNGSASNMLTNPHGVFVDNNFNLYVADWGNNRVQLFLPGELTGTTVAGNGSINTTITLNGPTGVVLDANKYLFIVDNLNNRIVGSGPNGFRCLVGCSGQPGTASDQLYCPRTLSFDSYGNMLVVDELNSRIQKFFLSFNFCGKYIKEFNSKKNIFIL